MTFPSGSAELQPSLLAPYANARLLLFSTALAGVSESARTGRFVFEVFLKRLQWISARENAPGVDTGDFSCEGYLTRAAELPLAASQPWDWLAAGITWSSSGLRPLSTTTPLLVAPCHGAIWLGDLAALTTPGELPALNRAQLAGFSVLEFGGPHGPGGIGRLSQPLLGERITAALKPNRIALLAPGDSTEVLAARHGTTAAVLQLLNPDLPADPTALLPAGGWLFIPRRRTSGGSR